MYKVEPINLLNDLLTLNISQVSVGPYMAKKLPTGEVGLSKEMALELAREGMAYKTHWIAANALAALTNHAKDGGYVSSRTLEEATDLYVEARNVCRALFSMDARDVKRER